MKHGSLQSPLGESNRRTLDAPRYLLQRGLCPSNYLFRDAKVLLSLLQDEASEKMLGLHAVIMLIVSYGDINRI